MRPNIRLVRELGEGGMGSVWIADHLALGTHVAVKFLHHHLAEGSEEILERFRLEAQAAAKLDCPHVVQIFDFGLTTDGTPFIVMELMRGESLAERLDRDGWTTVEDCVEIVQQTAKALQAAHDHGFVHRDVKPDNIFLCEQEDGFFVKLLDFGVAKDTGARAKGYTMPGTMVGTPEYLSREAVLGGARVDHHADLWALAVVAYEMLTGDVPFTGDSLAMISIAILEAQCDRATNLRRGLPPAIDEFFDRAFAPSPDDRHADARELARGLEIALTSMSDPVPAGRESTPAQGSSSMVPVQPRRGTLLVAGVAAAGALAWGLAAWPATPTPAHAGLTPSVIVPDGPEAPATTLEATPSNETPPPTSRPRPGPPPSEPHRSAASPPRHVPPPADGSPPATPTTSPPSPASPPSPPVRADYGF